MNDDDQRILLTHGIDTSTPQGRDLLHRIEALVSQAIDDIVTAREQPPVANGTTTHHEIDNEQEMRAVMQSIHQRSEGDVRGVFEATGENWVIRWFVWRELRRRAESS